MIVNLPLARVTFLGFFFLSATEEVCTVTVDEVIVIVTVHGNDVHVTVMVTVVPLSVAPPPTLAGEMASAAWKGCANTEPLLIHAAQPWPAPLTELVT